MMMTPSINNATIQLIPQANLSIHSEAIEQFKAAMLDAGIQPPDKLIADGLLHRFKINGKLDGAYVMHLDGIAAGYFQDFKQGIKLNWKSSAPRQKYTDAQRQAYKALAAKQESDRKVDATNRHNQAAITAGFIWRNSPEVTAKHPYLIKKRIQPHGAHLYKRNLIVPIYSIDSQLVNLQTISADGTKRFLPGGKKKACFSIIGEPSETILICEGYATGCSLYEHSGHSVIVAMDAGNLEPVALAISQMYPANKIILAAENDESRMGEQKAREAALSVGCVYIMPPVLGDFNDYLAGGV